MKVQKQSTFSITQASKILKFNGGRKRFFEWLKRRGYLLSNNDPAQKYLNFGWFELRIKKIHKTNPPLVVPVTRMTLKGLAAIQKAVLKDFPICPPCVGVI